MPPASLGRERENLNLIPSSGFGFLEILSFELFSLQPKYKVRGKEWLHFFLFFLCVLFCTLSLVFVWWFPPPSVFAHTIHVISGSSGVLPLLRRSLRKSEPLLWLRRSAQSGVCVCVRVRVSCSCVGS